MPENIPDLLLTAAIGLAAWFVKDFLFGVFRKRAALERQEWEYRLKEVYCPLYFWSGLLMFTVRDDVRTNLAASLNEVMARSAYAVSRPHYHTLVRLVERAYDQRTTRVSEESVNATRRYLYDHIEALTALLYRMEAAAGVGDPASVLEPFKRTVRLVLIGASQLLVWAIVAGAISGVLALTRAQGSVLLGALVVMLLILLLVDVRHRRSLLEGVRKRLQVE